MKKLTLLIFTILNVMSLQVLAQETSDDYVFRNDVRPEYNKNITVDKLSTLQQSEAITLIDVRLSEDFALDPILIPGADYNDPEMIAKWADLIPKDKKVILYCVKGAWVSHKAANYLNDRGYNVSTLDGGIRQWKIDNKVE
jgi:rhodanese-related sulfurtransferase